MAFSEAQVHLLAGKLNRRVVQTRELDGRQISYIEGWHVIAEANRIFGFDGWDREMVWAERVWEDPRRDPKACAYAARVRIRVRAGEVTICREGSGVGHGSGATLGEAHEAALKEAETDATKRALVTFGNLFGLALYDKEQTGVRGTLKPPAARESSSLGWPLLSADGRILTTSGDPKVFCTRLRQALMACTDTSTLRALWDQNAPMVEVLRNHRPDLITRKRVHFAVLLERVFEQRLLDLAEPHAGTSTPPALNETEVQTLGSVDKAVLALPAPKRLRDRDHLQYVAKLACLVCGRTPSQAHHLRFSQPRALGLKVSDEWTVPLCNLHHRALHDAGDEERWWAEQSIDARAEAERLWRGEHAVNTSLGNALLKGSSSIVPD